MTSGPDSLRATRYLRIFGRVQGVGFRDALRAEARSRGLCGWVRNRRDGSVEAVLQGRADAVEGVSAWARHGPPASRVDRIEVQDVREGSGGEFDRRYAGFDWLPTA